MVEAMDDIFYSDDGIGTKDVARTRFYHLLESMRDEYEGVLKRLGYYVTEWGEIDHG